MRDVRTIATEKVYSIIGETTGTRKEVVLYDNITSEKVAEIEAEMGESIFYKQNETNKVVLKMKLDAFAQVAEREVIKID